MLNPMWRIEMTRERRKMTSHLPPAKWDTLVSARRSVWTQGRIQRGARGAQAPTYPMNSMEIRGEEEGEEEERRERRRKKGAREEEEEQAAPLPVIPASATVWTQS